MYKWSLESSGSWWTLIQQAMNYILWLWVKLQISSRCSVLWERAANSSWLCGLPPVWSRTQHLSLWRGKWESGKKIGGAGTHRRETREEHDLETARAKCGGGREGKVEWSPVGPFQALQVIAIQISVWGAAVWYQHMVEWMLLDEASFISAANIYQVFPWGIDSLDFVVTRAKPKHIESPKRSIIYLTKICFKKILNDMLILNNAFNFSYLKSEHSQGICHLGPQNTSSYLCWAPTVLFWRFYGLTVEGWSPLLACVQHEGKDWMLFIWHHNGLSSLQLT